MNETRNSAPAAAPYATVTMSPAWATDESFDEVTIIDDKHDAADTITAVKILAGGGQWELTLDWVTNDSRNYEWTNTRGNIVTITYHQ